MNSVQYKVIRSRAIALRKEGHTYSEIIKVTRVAKSTLSIWLRDVGIAKEQQQTYSEKKRLAGLRGAKARKSQRIDLTKKIHQRESRKILSINDKELWYMGTILYWAEGSKEKVNRPGTGVELINSDPYVIKLFIKWLVEVCKVEIADLVFNIYIHESKKDIIEKVINYWSNITDFDKRNFAKIYFKKNIIKTVRKSEDNIDYRGILKIKVKASSELNRRIAGWITGIKRYYWGVVEW